MGGGSTNHNVQSHPTVNFNPSAMGGGNISIGGSVGTGDVSIGGSSSSSGASTTADVGVKVSPVLLLNLEDVVNNVVNNDNIINKTTIKNDHLIGKKIDGSKFSFSGANNMGYQVFKLDQLQLLI